MSLFVSPAQYFIVDVSGKTPIRFVFFIGPRWRLAMRNARVRNLERKNKRDHWEMWWCMNWDDFEELIKYISYAGRFNLLPAVSFLAQLANVRWVYRGLLELILTGFTFLFVEEVFRFGQKFTSPDISLDTRWHFIYATAHDIFIVFNTKLTEDASRSSLGSWNTCK